MKRQEALDSNDQALYVEEARRQPARKAVHFDNSPGGVSVDARRGQGWNIEMPDGDDRVDD